MKKAIIGAGGFASEVYWSLPSNERKFVKFFVDNSYWTTNSGDLVLPLSEFDPNEFEVVVAIGNPEDRYNIIKKLPKNTKYFTHIHHSVNIMDPNIKIGEGSIICAGSILTTNITIGKHTHLNLHTTIGHDCEIGDFFTTAPGVKISGNCKIGDSVYVGTNASVKQKIIISDNVTIGMNAAVVKNINNHGTYVGVPAKKIII